MLTITLAETDEDESVTLELEHSLLSLSKWEAEHEKPFFGKDGKTPEETISYIRKMVTSGSIPDNFLERLHKEDFAAINGYINSKQTATWFRPDGAPKKGVAEIVTNELIYYWMISLQIPFKPCENWHISRLMTLIEVCGRKQTKPKKMSKAAQIEEMRRLNAERRKQLGTDG